MAKRWFMKTHEGEILDGPFRTDTLIGRRRFERAVAKYVEWYKYKPVLVEEEVDLERKDATVSEEPNQDDLPEGP